MYTLSKRDSYFKALPRKEIIVPLALLLEFSVLGKVEGIIALSLGDFDLIFFNIISLFFYFFAFICISSSPSSF
jgi:hypothetical protein